MSTEEPSGDSREYVELPGVTTLRPEQWYMVEPDGCVMKGSVEHGWIRAPFAAAELMAVLELGLGAGDPE